MPSMLAFAFSKALLKKLPSVPMMLSMAVLMLLPMVPKSRARMDVMASLNRPSRLLPSSPSPLIMLFRISLPSPIQSVAINPSQIALTRSGTLPTRSGMPCTRPVAIFTTASMPAGISSGSAAMIPSSSPPTSSPAALTRVGRFCARKLARLVTILVASSVIGPILAATASTIVCSRPMAAGRMVFIKPGKYSARVFATAFRLSEISGAPASIMSIIVDRPLLR